MAAASANGGEGFVLIVEDDADIAELERDYLEASGFSAEIQGTGTAGLTRALSGEFDLVLLDVMLPGMSGMDVCRTLRERTDIPIVMVTARGSDIDKIRGLGLGADDYVEKPFSPSVLVARVKAHVARYRRLTGADDASSQRAAIESGDVRVEPATRRAFVCGREVELRAREFDLLSFLMRNEGVVFSRDALHERVWGIDAMGDASTVVVHVKRLRDKMGRSSGGSDYIETVRNAGYRFNGSPDGRAAATE